MKTDKLYFGAAYYSEYLPYDRVEKDMEMMEKAGMNVIRITESTWSTLEPQEGVYDFTHIDRMLNAAACHHISVIVGTPTYAVPTWLVKKYPDILAITQNGRERYGHRQNMDITNPDYLSHAERVIRVLMEHVKDVPHVIGYQLDNETKSYGTAGPRVQAMFVDYLKENFPDINDFNHEFGLDYWSNRVNDWDDFPDVRGTINQSLAAEFCKFQRSLVTKFLSWQADIVREYKRDDQFITQNFDFDWTTHSIGYQSQVDQYDASRCMTVAGADIYHPSNEELTGAEITVCGNISRSLKKDNYLILETEAQGLTPWLPYPGQLRLQAYSHIANGSNSVMYWHWHSIHNSFETYWKGLLSHDFAENDTYREACIIGKEFREKGSRLVNLKKKNDVAVMVSNEALTALNWFGIQATSGDNGEIRYNDVVRWIYDALYQMNVECDFVWPESENLSRYKAIFVPALYAVPDSTLQRLNRYVEEGGTLVVTFKSGFANENVKVHVDAQPHILKSALGISYNQFTFPREVKLAGKLYGEARVFMELLKPEGAEVLAGYEHYNWKGYAAITRNKYGKGTAYYLGCMTDDATLQNVIKDALGSAGVELSGYSYPVIVRKGTNDLGKTIRYFLNYSGSEQAVTYKYGDAEDVITGKEIKAGTELKIPAWNVRIIEA